MRLLGTLELAGSFLKRQSRPRPPGSVPPRSAEAHRESRKLPVWGSWERWNNLGTAGSATVAKHSSRATTVPVHNRLQPEARATGEPPGDCKPDQVLGYGECLGESFQVGGTCDAGDGRERKREFTSELATVDLGSSTCRVLGSWLQMQNIQDSPSCDPDRTGCTANYGGAPARFEPRARIESENLIGRL